MHCHGVQKNRKIAEEIRLLATRGETRSLGRSNPPLCLTAPVIDISNATKTYIYKLEVDCKPILYGKCHS